MDNFKEDLKKVLLEHNMDLKAFSIKEDINIEGRLYFVIAVDDIKKEEKE